MAELYRTTKAGETAQHFVQFLMMHQQQTLLALGQHPQSPAGARPNLELARAFILQLAAIRDRVQGNLSPEEEGVLATTLSHLEARFAEVSR